MDLQRESKVLDYILARPIGPFKTEAEMLRKTKDIAHLLGALVVREESEVRGRSDLVLCYDGHFVALELKDDVGTPSPHQIEFVNKVKIAGGRAGVCNTLIQAFMIIVGNAR